jgi:hypothetical protein
MASHLFASPHGGISLGNVNSAYLTAPVINISSISSASPQVIGGAHPFLSNYGVGAFAKLGSSFNIPTVTLSNSFYAQNMPVLLLNIGTR